MNKAAAAAVATAKIFISISSHPRRPKLSVLYRLTKKSIHMRSKPLSITNKGSTVKKL